MQRLVLLSGLNINQAPSTMELCELLISKSFTIISIVAEDGTLKFESDAAERITGYIKGSRDNQVIFDYIHPEDKPAVIQTFNELILEPERVRKFQFRHRNSDGSWIWIEAYGQNYISNPDVKGVIVNCRDISEIKEAEIQIRKQDESLVSIIENLPLAVFAHDLDGRILIINENAIRYTGYSKAELMAMNVSDIDHEVVSRDDRKNIWESLNFGQRKAFHVVHNRKDGSKYDAEINLSPIVINDQPILLAAALDITERIESEETLRRNEENYRKLNAAKDKFFRILSHDLRGPLGAVERLSKMLERNFDDMDSKRQKDMISMLSRASEATMNLLSDLLAWSRTQTGTVALNPEKILLKDFVNSNFTIVEEQAEIKNIKLINEMTDQLSIQADRSSMNTVLRNLLSNAIKFTRPGGEVRIFGSVIQDKGQEHIEIEIRDSGVGMDKEKATRIFCIEHAESEPGTANEKGTGLGLIVCKELVEINNGALSFTSEIGKGTSFFIKMPGA